ncbi:DapH/DapD/GlmU-related protein [Sphingobium sp.]|uniref:acyltransferase n=1 Tax=Sphingobium sp. TaxID=1912891 RepID=UPI000DB2BD78|nr:DapH/DapD/GlmU-related protein [Sphingobium sp.]PZU62885.1 MAG: hypothetical protein DI540_25460 [Sphingobium sp.]
MTATHSVVPSIYRRDRGETKLLRTEIHNGCWIGLGVTILPGIVIGEGCVIAAGSVVNKNCEKNGLYAGVPAKRVKDLPVLSLYPFHNGVEVDESFD